MDCAKIDEMLPAYLEGELGVAEAAAVRQHLQGCASCRARQDALQQALAALDAWTGMEPPAGFSQRVLLALDREMNKRQERRLGAGLGAVLFMAFLMVAAFMGSTFGHVLLAMLRTFGRLGWRTLGVVTALGGQFSPVQATGFFSLVLGLAALIWLLHRALVWE